MYNPTVTKFYNTQLNFAEKIYAAQKRYNGAASAEKVRTEEPATGFSRVTQAARLGTDNGFATGNTFGNKISSPLLRNAAVTGALGATAHIVPQLPSGIVLPYVGNIAAVGGSIGLTALVGTGASYNPATDSSRFSWIPKALAHYGVVGFVTEQPLAAISRNYANNDYVATTASVLACVARIGLEIPRATLAGASALLFTGVPALAGATIGCGLNVLHSLFSSKPAAGLVASGSPVAATFRSTTAATQTAPVMSESVTGSAFGDTEVIEPAVA